MLKNDWKRVRKVFEEVKGNHWNPSLIYSVSIYDLRKFDRGIDYPLRRLLDSQEYGNRITTFGAPCCMFGKHPFRWNGKVWHSIRIQEFLILGNINGEKCEILIRDEAISKGKVDKS